MPVTPVVVDIGHSLSRIMRATNRLKARMSTDGQRGEWTAFRLLGTLADTGPMRLTQLAERIHVDPSTLSRQVATLVDEGLVERRLDPLDGRASTVACTPSGEQFLAKKRHFRDEFVADLMQDWSAADRQRFADLLQRFSTALDATLIRCAHTLEKETS